jgi:prephenate dehydrogenase
LIGGSLAKAIRARFPGRGLIGVEPNARRRVLARRDRIFSKVLPRPTEELSRCEVVVLCAPVRDVLALLAPVSALMRDGTFLTDVCGIKRPIVQAARSRVRAGVSFVGAHPMFGGERGGYAGSHASLWKGGTVAITTDRADRAALAAVSRLHRELGARIVTCTAAAHDSAVAAVSHLPYVVASALALTARGRGTLARRLAGRGLADTTRLASFQYGIQGEAARRNVHLVPVVRAFGKNLRELLAALASSEATARRAFAPSRAAREALPGHTVRRKGAAIR